MKNIVKPIFISITFVSVLSILSSCAIHDDPYGRNNYDNTRGGRGTDTTNDMNDANNDTSSRCGILSCNSTQDDDERFLHGNLFSDSTVQIRNNYVYMAYHFDTYNDTYKRYEFPSTFSDFRTSRWWNLSTYVKESGTMRINAYSKTISLNPTSIFFNSRAIDYEYENEDSKTVTLKDSQISILPVVYNKN